MFAVFADRLRVDNLDVAAEKRRLRVGAAERGELGKHADQRTVHVSQVESGIDVDSRRQVHACESVRRLA